MPERPAYLHVTETHLTCSGLHEVAPDVAAAILEWLHAHGLDENQIVANTPIVRDPDRRQLMWTQVNRAGSSMVIFDNSPLTASPVSPWPAPFPQILLDQQPPDHCLACGRPFDDEERQ